LGTTAVLAQGISSCPGYAAANVKHHNKAITADLTLEGSPCNAYGNDIKDLKLLVEYQTGGYWLVNVSSKTNDPQKIGYTSKYTMPMSVYIRFPMTC
jgi:alpha-glucosidase